MNPAGSPRGLVIAGVHSGVGKTTITLGLIAALKRRGLKVQPFKVGPDFIDPGHHTRVAGCACRNLDGWMLSREANLAIFDHHAVGADVAVVEGVMGLFDGYDGRSEAGSTAQMAKWLGLPVVLVADARSMARSAAALVHGFASFDPDLTLAGVIFNRIGSPTHLRYLEQALEQSGEVTCLGGIPRDRELNIPERHLGLTTAQDHPLTPEYIHHLADLIEKCLDLDALLVKGIGRAGQGPMAPDPSPKPSPPTPYRGLGGEFERRAGELISPGPPLKNNLTPIRLGVAQDRAFCFYYPENLEWLEHFGAQIVPFSPLTDTELPPDLHGLYLGGGYPELFATQLAENHPMMQAIGEQARAGMPIYAECGGLMYLSREITDLDGKPHTMAGLLPFTVRMLPRLKSLGYREIILMAEGLLGPPGTRARGHEFHYSEIVSESPEPGRLYRILDRQGENSRWEGYTLGNVLASYVHLHFSSNPEVARHLVRNCRGFKEGG